MLSAWIDGACDPNPGGRAGYGIIVRYGEGTIIYQRSMFIGEGSLMSNNVAEYCALLELIKWNASKIPTRVHSDSMMLVNQMMGFWGARKGLYVNIFHEVWDTLRIQGFPHNYTFIWIEREENYEADELATTAIMRRSSRLTQVVGK